MSKQKTQAKLIQTTGIEFEQGRKRLSLPESVPLTGYWKDGFFYFDTRLGPARLPKGCFVSPENEQQ
jgi:hypothetical protein